jgi:hypothetical protein
LVSSEIREKVFDFIRNNPNCNKNQVVKGVPEYSRLTILQAIEELMDIEETDKRVKYIRDKPKGFYKLFINDENKFNQISERFTLLKKSISVISKVVSAHRLNVNTKKTRTLRVMQTLTELIEHSGYLIISYLAISIQQNIKSSNDREFLYRELVSVLIAFQKLNKILVPQLVMRSRSMLEASRKEKVFEEQPALYDRIVRELLLMPDSESDFL